MFTSKQILRPNKYVIKKLGFMDVHEALDDVRMKLIGQNILKRGIKITSKLFIK